MNEFKMRIVLSSLLMVLPLTACQQAQAQQAAPPLPLPVAQSPQQPSIRESQALPSLAPLVDSVKAAVVNVDVQSRVVQGRGEELDGEGEDFFGRFFGGQQGRGGPGGRWGQRNRTPLRQGQGSGTIIDGRGLVLTNNHVVEGAVAIRVKLDDGRQFSANVVGRDPLTDVALIRLDLKGKTESLPVAKLGDSEVLRPGDWVVAIGNPFGLASSVSVGIISAKARHITQGPYDDFLQTDAAINPGNSGGPLFNMRGEVIGINTAIIGGGTGIGFAVPASLAKALLPQLEESGVVKRGYLGINVQTLTSDLGRAMGVSATEGAIVAGFGAGSPAKKGGVQADDVIIALDGEKVVSSEQLTRVVALKRPGSTVTVSLLRGSKKQDVKVVLGTRPGGEEVANREESSSEDEGRNARIGLTFGDLNPRMAQEMGFDEGRGAVIFGVAPNSAAERAELVRGMIIIEADRKPIRSRSDLEKALRSAKPGSALLLRILVPGQDGATTLRALTIP